MGWVRMCGGYETNAYLGTATPGERQDVVAGIHDGLVLEAEPILYTRKRLEALVVLNAEDTGPVLGVVGRAAGLFRLQYQGDYDAMGLRTPLTDPSALWTWPLM
ncbi:hypothetical protein BV25DRAFT_292749 [Artomyces pyxidatus]|uniref:Uncharacterized protein n=1 Tax=Artomyces pyxidatus TaxID=48021 RepID=A0ACB8SFP6_9AGAM|nr:hypothetical protein BV25DRAFT_292749 [Artomyces pyxidatus]